MILSKFHYLLTYLLTTWSWTLIERPLDVRPFDSFPAFHGTWRFNTEFTRDLHLFLSWARSIQSTSPHLTSPRSILILSTHLRLGLPTGLFPSGFPTNNLYWFLFSPIRGSLEVFVTSFFLRWGVVKPTPNPQAGGPPVVVCPRLLIKYIRS
jgi:hypothetical protein